MENSIIDEEKNLCTEIMNNVRVLRYKQKYAGENYFKDPVFKKWFEEEFEKKGDKAYFGMCKHCNIFYILDRHENIHCCDTYESESLCKYCGDIFYGHSYCCLRKALEEDFGEYLLDGYYTCNKDNTDGLIECAKVFPLVFRCAFAGTLFCAFFLHRRGTNHENINSFYSDRLNTLALVAQFFMYAFVFIYCLVFYFPLSICHNYIYFFWGIDKIILNIKLYHIFINIYIY